MIEMVVPYIRNMEARAIPPYQEFLKAQRSFITRRYKRINESQGHESPGVKLLRYIIQFVDLDYLDSLPNNYERYTSHMKFIRKDLNNIFDKVSRGRGWKNLFFDKNRYHTEEFLLPVEDINTISNLPLYTEDWNTWKKIKPLRIWSHNSEEYTTNVNLDRINFRRMPPSYAMELLDVIALVFKYYIWYKHQRMNEPDLELAIHIPQQLFIHRYVLDSMVWDLSDIWLLSCLNKIFDMDDISGMSEFDSQYLQVESQYGWVAQQSRRGMESIWRLVNDVKSNLRPEALLSSTLLYSGSINNRILLADNQLNIPILSQYDYLRWLRDKDMMKFYVQVWKSREDLPTTNKILINIRRDFQRLLNRRPWQTCNNVLLKNEIENEMREFAYLL